MLHCLKGLLRATQPLKSRTACRLLYNGWCGGQLRTAASKSMDGSAATLLLEVDAAEAVFFHCSLWSSCDRDCSSVCG